MKKLLEQLDFFYSNQCITLTFINAIIGFASMFLYGNFKGLFYIVDISFINLSLFLFVFGTRFLIKINKELSK